jgi:cbb3-type cytochrome oxidase subunit 1
MVGVASKNAPPPSVVVPHFVFGAISFLVLTILILFNVESISGHYFNPKLLSLVHLTTLGWISMIIFGALYQLVPVVLDVKLHNEKLAKINFYIYAISIITFVFAFWNLYSQTLLFQIGGSLMFTSITLFSYNIMMSAFNAKRKLIAAKFIIASIFWFFTTAVFGLILVFQLTNPYMDINHLQFLKAHAHFGMVGWFLLLIIGVSSRLIPMFLVTHNLNEKKLSFALYVINIGLVALATVFFIELDSIYIILSGLIIVVGIASYVSFLIDAYRNRIKKILDIGMQHSAMAIITLIFPIAFAAIAPFTLENQFELSQQSVLVYGISILLGFVTSLLLGQTYKTLPFIVWLFEYRGKMGKGKTPLPKDLYNERIAEIHYFTFAIGFLALVGGVLMSYTPAMYVGSVFFVITALLYNYNVIKIIRHKSEF